ncbi:MAG TPA: DUF4910 domain-containing protein [Armatimonadetes bacterium]|nr:DUF4910 domain-containing protein [Armatimonadota bacterium]
MFRSVLDAIIGELNAGSCLRDIANHWSCRCTVPGPGMRRAAEILKRRYEESGTTGAEIIPYPADDRTEFLDGSRNPLEWRPEDASLSVVQPVHERICRYAQEPLCLVSNSTATPPRGVTAEVVVRSGPLPATAVAPGEMAGRFLFTDQPAGTVEAAARKAGALGVISDCISPPWLVQYPPVREPEDAPDLVMWSIFSGRRDDRPLFGFNLSVRQGRRLRRLIEQSSEPVRLHAEVRAELVEGSSDFLHATIPGTDLAEEEIWVLAHLSEPGARDNASGCCLSVELARTLAALIARGVLPPPRRTIRFMHAVEVHGFLPFIDANRDRLGRQVVAGLCLDSVGQDLVRGGGFLVLYRSPEQNASFVDGLMETLLGAVAAEPAGRFSHDNYATFPWRIAPFWGNDAFISDGFFDIPTPQLSTWPDRYYHSSHDTPDRMSANTLGRVGAAAGSFLYLLARAGAAEARWFGLLAADDWKRRICRAVTDEVTAALSEPNPEAAGHLLASVRHLGLQARDAVMQAARFAPGDAGASEALHALADDLSAFAEREAIGGARLLDPTMEVARPAASAGAPGGEIVARRRRWHAPSPKTLSPASQERLAALGPNAARIWAWINGRRTAREIEERLRHGGPVPLEGIVEYLRVMSAEGAVEIH